MGKYNTYAPQEKRDTGPRVHPVWRGVGFVMIILIPLLSYAAADVLIQQNLKANWFPMPYDLVTQPGTLLYNGDPWLYLKLVITVAIALILFALFTLFTFIMNSAFAPPRYGPFDAPPIKAKVRKKAR